MISIVVPVYNIESYIRKCVGSIMEQTYKNIEIILVDDGSTDACPAVCDKLAEADARIKVLHTANGGPSAARNAAMKASTGDRIAFIDGDDYVTADYILHLHELMEEYHTEISVTNSRIQSEEENEEEKSPHEQKPYILLMDRREALETFLYQRYFGPSVWGKLFHRSLFDGIEFPDGKTAGDLAIIYKLLDRAERIVYSSVVDYIYVQRMTSIVHSQQDKVESDASEFLEEMTRYIADKHPDLEKAVAYYRFEHSSYYLKQAPFREIYEKRHAQLRGDILKYRKSVLTDPRGRLNTRACAALSYLGIGALKACRTVYDKLRKC